MNQPIDTFCVRKLWQLDADFEECQQTDKEVSYERGTPAADNLRPYTVNREAITRITCAPILAVTLITCATMSNRLWQLDKNFEECQKSDTEDDKELIMF